MKKLLLPLIILSLIALWPFFRKGYFESHDGEWMVIRFSAFHQTLVGGQFPVRFVERLNNNYGYPVLNFLYPLPFYLAEIPKLLGFGFVASIKIEFIAATMASVLAMYWALSQMFGKYASLTGAILYLFVPYRFVDLYVRGSLGENLAFTFIPLVFGSILKITRGNQKFLPILALSVACLIISHNVIAVIFLPFFLLVSLLIAKNAKKTIFWSFLIGILISSFFWIPALYDLRFVYLSKIKVSNIQDHLVNIRALLVPSWGFGPNPNSPSGLSTQFGIVTLAVVIAVLFLRFYAKIKNQLIDLMLIILVLIFVLMTKFSLPFWQHIPLLDVIQFPWRLLSAVVFIGAFLAAFVIDSSQKKMAISIVLIAAGIFSTILYTKPLSFVDRGDGFYSTNEDTTTVLGEYLPLWVKEKPQERADQKIEVTKDQATIEQIKIRGTFYEARIIANDSTKVKVNTIYFPGWQVKIDGRKTPIDYQNPFGLIEFHLPKGNHKVIINYTKTPVHTAAEIISLVALLLTGVYFYRTWRRQNS